MSGLRVLVCGGRDYNDRERVWRELDALQPSEIIEGGAPGADDFAAQWAFANIAYGSLRTFPAEWHLHGKAAGPIRNARMLDEGKPDLVLAFPGGRGTEDMKRRARAAGIEVREVAA